jgi:hypothetical protein
MHMIFVDGKGNKEDDGAMCFAYTNVCHDLEGVMIIGKRVFIGHPDSDNLESSSNFDNCLELCIHNVPSMVKALEAAYNYSLLGK